MSNTVGHTVEDAAAHTAPRPSAAKRRTAFALSGALAAAVVAFPFQSASAAPAGDDSCVLEELPMPEGLYFSLVTGMSTDGSVIAYRAYPAGLEGDERYPYLYRDGEMVPVPIPGLDQNVTDVNSEGLAVGVSYVDDVMLPYVFRDGEVTELAVNDGGAATGVNEAGDIVGIGGQYPRVPIVWRDGEVKPQTLPLPDNASEGFANAIDEDGTIVGAYVDSETGNARPYVWHPDGTGEELAIPEGFDPATAILSTSGVAEEWVVGNLLTPDTEAAVRWNLEDGTVEVLDLVYAPAINEEGTAVGQDLNAVDAAYQEEDEKAAALPGLSDPADNWFGDIATEIDEDGELLAGQVYAGEDETGAHILKAVVWDCD